MWQTILTAKVIWKENHLFSSLEQSKFFHFFLLLKNQTKQWQSFLKQNIILKWFHFGEKKGRKVFKILLTMPQKFVQCNSLGINPTFFYFFSQAFGQFLTQRIQTWTKLAFSGDSRMSNVVFVQMFVYSARNNTLNFAKYHSKHIAFCSSMEMKQHMIWSSNMTFTFSFRLNLFQ